MGHPAQARKDISLNMHIAFDRAGNRLGKVQGRIQNRGSANSCNGHNYTENPTITILFMASSLSVSWA